MKKHLIFLISIFVFMVSCSTYKPFNSLKEKKTQLNLIKTKFSLTKAEYKKIKNEDSIVFTIAKSLQKEIKTTRLERRLDSFFMNNYDQKDLLVMLLMDYHFPNFKHEINRNADNTRLEFKNIDEIKKFFQAGGTFEKDMEKILDMKKIKDSTNSKKNKNN